MVKARVSSHGVFDFKEFKDDERIVVKFRLDSGKTQEVSMYLQDDGRIDCRYFAGAEDVGGKLIFSGMLWDDGLVIGETTTPEVFNG